MVNNSTSVISKPNLRWCTVDFDSYSSRLVRGAARADTSPTESQRKALNFRHGIVRFHGLDVMIENPVDSFRTGRSPDGVSWRRKVTAHYGRIKRTVGRDGEPVDVWICPDHPESQLVFVFSQLDSDGNLDEHKVVIGTRNVVEAKSVISDNYPAGWLNDRIGEIRGMTMSQFRDWLKTGDPVKSPRHKSAVDWLVVSRLGFK